MVTITFRVRRGREDVVHDINRDMVQPHYGIAYHLKDNGDNTRTFMMHGTSREDAERLFGPYKAHGRISDVHFLDDDALKN